MRSTHPSFGQVNETIIDHLGKQPHCLCILKKTEECSDRIQQSKCISLAISRHASYHAVLVILVQVGKIHVATGQTTAHDAN